MPNRRSEDSPQYQPGAGQYRPRTMESDDEIDREFASVFDDRFDPETPDTDLLDEDDALWDGTERRRSSDDPFPA